MEQTIVQQALEQISNYLEDNRWDQAVSLLESLRPPDQADVFEVLPEEQQQALLPRLELEDSADILEEMDDEEAAHLAARLQAEALAAILDEMEADEAADLLGDLPSDLVKGILARMKDAELVRPLLIHPDESAGGLMTSEFPALREKQTVAEALACLRAWAPEEDPGSQRSYYIYVVDREQRLRGVVSLLRLLATDPWKRVKDVMDRDIMSVQAGADQEECAQLLARYDLLSLPVVNGEHRLIGIITADDLVDVLQNEATEDIQRLGGAEPLSRPYLSTGIWQMTRKRIGWLLLLFITATLTGEVMRLFEHELAAVVALTYFIPLLIGTGGNAGSQTTNLVIRALAVGDVRLRDFLRVFWHEIRTGLFLGLCMGGVAYLRASTWVQDPWIALTVALSIVVIVLWSTSVGSLLPMLAERLHIDPTVVSGPAMSTLVDAAGLFIYLSIAKVVLGV
ncbi:MAG: magnesium transporter [Chloroflexia bacterium]|nr:magnesium transporter [Chloroflexia bacterium]